jgi:outer membrane protein TolC
MPALTGIGRFLPSVRHAWAEARIGRFIQSAINCTTELLETVMKKQNVHVWITALVIAATTAAASAQQPSGPATTAPAAPPQTQVDRYIVGQARPPAEPGTSVRDLSLQQAIDVALENNLALKSAKMNPQIQDYSLVQARAVFRPTLQASLQQTSSSQVSTNSFDGVPMVTQRGSNYSGTFSQNLQKFGANYSAQYTTRRSTNNSLSNLRPLQYTGSTSFNYTQPLLANFKIDDRRNALRTQAIQRQIVDIQLQQTIENTKANVRSAYWALRRTIEQVEIQRRALELSQRLWNDNRTKVEIGTMAPIDLFQNEATVATNEQSLLNARINWQNSELAFKQLLASGIEDALYSQTINPTEQPPALEQVSVDIPRAVRSALDQRTDLTQQRKALEVSTFNLELSENATKPTLTLSAGYTLSGTGGDSYFSVNQQRAGLKEESGYSDVLKNIVMKNQPQWNLNVNFSYPLGMVSQKAAFARAQIQFQQSEANLKAQELSVSTQVTGAGLAVQNTWQQLQAARKSREAAEQQAAAEQTRFDNGMSNNYNIALAQNDLTSRRLSELNAIIAYVNAIADFEKTQKVGGGGGGQ